MLISQKQKELRTKTQILKLVGSCMNVYNIVRQTLVLLPFFLNYKLFGTSNSLSFFFQKHLFTKRQFGNLIITTAILLLSDSSITDTLSRILCWFAVGCD